MQGIDEQEQKKEYCVYNDYSTLTVAKLLRPAPPAASLYIPPLSLGVVDGSNEILTRFPDWGSWRETDSFTAPLANLILAFLAINFYSFAASNGYSFVGKPSVDTFFYLFVYINLLLMLFNLIPLGPLDGHYILPYFLPRVVAQQYRILNQRFGGFAVLGLVLLSYAGLPIFKWLQAAALWCMGAIRIVG